MSNETFTIDLNRICTCGQHHAISGTELCPHCTFGTEQSEQTSDRKSLDKAQRPQGRGLAGTLFDLILRAEKIGDGRFHPMPLQHGLTLEVGLGQHFNLRICRSDCTPSQREWQTVIDYLPKAYQPEAAVTPREFQHTDRHGARRWYLAADWPFSARKS